MRYYPWWPWVVLVAALLLFGGCDRDGKIRLSWPDGRRVEIDQPGKAIAPATITLGRDGSLAASTGAKQKLTPQLQAAKNTWISYIVGGVLALAGVGLLLAKKWLPLIPTTAGVYTMLAGAGVILIATLSVTIPWWAWMIVLGTGAVLVMPGVIANLRQPKETP